MATTKKVDAKKQEALNAIRAANPKWPDKLVEYAYMLMPVPYELYYAVNSYEWLYAKAAHAHFWTRWAISINILPDDTVVPDNPKYNPNVIIHRANHDSTLPQGVASYAMAKAPKTKTEVETPVATYMPPTFAVQRNGVWPPKPDSDGDKVWKVAEKLKGESSQIPSQEALLTGCANLGIETTAIIAEFTKWQKYVA